MWTLILIFYNYIPIRIIIPSTTTLQRKGFSQKITRPTRSVGNSHTLIDNVFTNNLCKRHTSGILTHQISDYFITLSIVDGNIKLFICLVWKPL